MTIPAFSLDTLPLARSANLALAQFKKMSALKDESLSGAGLLYERLLMLGLAPAASMSPNGSCHLVRCHDAMLAVNLPRNSDWELVPAWLGPWHDEISIAPNDWTALSNYCRALIANDLLHQAHSLGLAVAIADTLPSPPPSLAHRECFRDQSKTAQLRGNRSPLVIDLSSLWAGPLCSHLLQQAGCRVIKVEGLNRLDGARSGTPEFYALLNQGKESVVLDFRSEADIARLKQLIARADIVIEASRPRALRNIGIRAEDLVKSQSRLVWLSITGYGRQGADGERIGFGDDAAAAAGLCQIMFEATGDYQIAGDAIADPLTGIHAALSAWESHLNGGNELISFSLRDTVSYCLHQELNLARENVLKSCRQWHQLGNRATQLFPSGPRTPTTACATPGQHNQSVFEELDLVAGALQQQHHP
ncbi:MAG TPA: CoA transferase [Dongiaceae bacterium]|nr:CoA transferase [Dongiaceae bacterium]